MRQVGQVCCRWNQERRQLCGGKERRGVIQSAGRTDGHVELTWVTEAFSDCFVQHLSCRARDLPGVENRCLIYGRDARIQLPAVLSSNAVGCIPQASQWKHLRKSRSVKRATKRGEKSSLNTVNARHVSVTAYQERSMRC
ncbi:hypothetical protein EYF80_048747 [Liparis tanakae]|uniref:Uncharacterized protein n=1 Tax=Liparis tanakae TaxID=230148 RepID=A0A4Z2FJX7_9TELE|nr:hypothetical protein EYF80_048747 [Liparis tanakae]